MDQDKLILDGSKLMHHKDRIDAWLRGERIAPITIDCALTTKCSYRCVYCYGKMQVINQYPHLDKSVIFDFLDDAAAIGVKAISFVSDGESTCSPYLKDAIMRGKGNGLDMALGTNGFLLKDGELEDILPCLTYLRFNISAGEKNRYAYIHGCKPEAYDKVLKTIEKAVEIKKKNKLSVTIGLQMVLLPEFSDQIIPLTLLGKNLGVDYLVIKHCSDDAEGSLGVDYSKYYDLVDLLKTAETYSTDTYQVTAKWSKILSGGGKCYKKCYGPPFHLQFSGSGLIAPCGMFFNDKYKEFHIGNIRKMRFKDIWQSQRYWDVMEKIASDEFNPQMECSTLCLQHKTNEILWKIENNELDYETERKKELAQVQHVNFI